MKPTLDYRLKRSLDQASGHLLEAYAALSGFVEETSLWVTFEGEGAETMTALADRHRSVQQIQTALKTQTGKIAAEAELCATAWRAHHEAVTREPRIHPVTDDDRIAKALAARYAAVDSQAAEAALWCTLAELGVEPEGPDWARWGLTVWHDRLCWDPYVPAVPPTEPVWPAPIEPAGPAEAEHTAAGHDAATVDATRGTGAAQ